VCLFDVGSHLHDQILGGLEAPLAAQALVRWIAPGQPPGERLDPRGAAARTPAHRLRSAAYLLGRPVVARFGLRTPPG